MLKLFATVSAIGLAAMIAVPSPASAREQAGASMKNSTSIEVSSARRHYRYYRGGGRYYGARPYHRNYGYYNGYNSYGYNGYGYRPYYRPGVSVGVGPFGFGFGM